MNEVKSSKLYVVLPFFNGVSREFLESLKAQSYENFQLILVDDGSTDESLSLCQEYFPDSILLQGQGNLWWGGSLHQSYKYFQSNSVNDNDLVIFLNNDVELTSDFFAMGVQGLEPNSLFLAEAYCKKSREKIDAGVHVDWRQFSFKQAKEASEINCLSTRGLILKLEDFLAIGGFYPRLLPHYLSDYEFTMRAFTKGYKLKTDEAFRLYSDSSISGYHHPEKGAENLLDFLWRLFSKKCPINPIYRTSFLVLACPWPYLPQNLFKVWAVTLKLIILNVMSRKCDE
ncbi:glycosyltransferase [Lentisphaera profundi]|uniref:Glycosyltransferase n=1 Tax=Lentisphaera profundi TaxID=1658616 RepID=A0ABY7VP77_9BACT|nr:glycosyltransferase [Lentisphaera profundi]WDE95961.1 glycosyltransferase [Lentisphaera profundi]